MTPSSARCRSFPRRSMSLVGLPDTIWFPENGLAMLPDGVLSFLLFPVDRPEFFDAVVTDREDHVQEIQVKQRGARSNWIWGAFKMPGHVLRELFDLWNERGRSDEYFGTLVNGYLARGHRASAIRAGKSYVDIGTLHGYRSAINLLSSMRRDPASGPDSGSPQPSERHAKAQRPRRTGPDLATPQPGAHR